MASKLSSSSKQRVPFILYLLILSVFLLFLIISTSKTTKPTNLVTNIDRHQQVNKNEIKNEAKNVDWFVTISEKFIKIKGRKIKVGLVNVDDHVRSQLDTLADNVETVSVGFERIAEDRKWKDFFPEWIDEDEKYGGPECPKIPLPKLEDYGDIDVVLAKDPCETNDKEGVRDVFRLQVNLVVANLVVGRGWMKPDVHRTVYVVFIGSCGPMVEIFRCDDLLMHRGEYWVYRPHIGRLKQKVTRPVGSCQLAPGYAETGREVWRKFMLESSTWTPYLKQRLAYATILHTSEAYVCGAIALAQSIKQTNSTRDLVLLADHSISPTSIQGLTAAGWKIKRIQRIRSAFAQKGTYNEWNFSKLRLWQLTEYDKVIFLDADLLVQKDLDSFFVHPQLSAVGNNRMLFNSGLMVVEPSNCTFEYLMRKSLNIRSYNGGDQGFLNEIFTWWHRLPWRLNTLKMFQGLSSKNHYLAEDLYAIHYLGHKPWMCYRDYDCNWDTDNLQVFASDSAHRRWWKMYDKMPKELRSYCGLTKKMDANLRTRRASAAKANFSDGHWKIEVKDPRQHQL